MPRLTAAKKNTKRAENKTDDEAAAGMLAMIALFAAIAVLFSPYAPKLIDDNAEAESRQIYGAFSCTERDFLPRRVFAARQTTKINICAIKAVFSVDRWFLKWYDDCVCCATSVGELCAEDI